MAYSLQFQYNPLCSKRGPLSCIDQEQIDQQPGSSLLEHVRPASFFTFIECVVYNSYYRLEEEFQPTVVACYRHWLSSIGNSKGVIFVKIRLVGTPFSFSFLDSKEVFLKYCLAHVTANLT
jgi:hypothetical protein